MKISVKTYPQLATSLEPLEVLRLLKQIEKAVGRTKTFTNGPRVIDLDLVFYGHRVVKIGNETDEEDEYGIKWLECPHKRLREREFVLRPLAEYVLKLLSENGVPGADHLQSIDPEFTHPALRRSVGQLLASLPTTFPPSLSPIIPLHSHVSPLRLSIPASPYIMAIFNTTPDSFSDGDLTRTEVVYALAACEKLLKGPEPPAILDIGECPRAQVLNPVQRKMSSVALFHLSKPSGHRVIPSLHLFRYRLTLIDRQLPRLPLKLVRPSLTMSVADKSQECCGSWQKQTFLLF